MQRDNSNGSGDAAPLFSPKQDLRGLTYPFNVTLVFRASALHLSPKFANDFGGLSPISAIIYCRFAIQDTFVDWHKFCLQWNIEE